MISCLVLLCTKTYWWCNWKYCFCHIWQHIEPSIINICDQCPREFFLCFLKRNSCIGWHVTLFDNVHLSDIKMHKTKWQYFTLERASGACTRSTLMWYLVVQCVGPDWYLEWWYPNWTVIDVSKIFHHLSINIRCVHSGDLLSSKMTDTRYEKYVSKM
jgi:hypothetical protein